MKHPDSTEAEIIDDAICYVAISDSIVDRAIDSIPDMMTLLIDDWEDYCSTCHEVLEDHLTCEHQQNVKDKIVIENAHSALDVVLDAHLKKHIERLIGAFESEIRCLREVIQCKK